MSRTDLNCIFKNKSKKIYIYRGTETDTDPYEHNVTVSLLPPLIIRGLVSDLTFAQIQWKMPGIKTAKAKEIYIEKRYRNLLEQSQKIEIKDDFGAMEPYIGWRENGRMQIREEGGYLRVYIYSRP